MNLNPVTFCYYVVKSDICNINEVNGSFYVQDYDNTTINFNDDFDSAQKFKTLQDCKDIIWLCGLLPEQISNVSVKKIIGLHTEQEVDTEKICQK